MSGVEPRPPEPTATGIDPCDCAAHAAPAGLGGTDRASVLARAIRLEYFTVAWNVIEGVVCVTAGAMAGSVALLAFGIDSFVEMTSGAILLWRLRGETRDMTCEAVERMDHRAKRLVAASLVLLAAYVAADASWTLWAGERPLVSRVGIVVTVVSIGVMLWLARAKRAAAAALGSRALEADAFQTTACWWLSVTALVGLGLNAALGWWWADPVAALVMCVLLLKEARASWKGDDCH